MNTIAIDRFEPLSYATEEAFNRLLISFNHLDKGLKKIMISSAVSGEGKSFIAMHLWRLLAESGAKVVLVDADIRKSVMRSCYNIKLKSGIKFCGLSSYLSGEVDLSQVIYKTNIENGYMVPTTNTVVSPTTLLQNSRFEAMLNYLEDFFDYVIIDTSPLTVVTDASLIATHCDGCILVVHSGATPRGVIKNSMTLLEQANCELMGVVLNRIELDNSPYYYKYRGNYSNYYDYSHKSTKS